MANLPGGKPRHRKAQFGSRAGLIAATVGSAVGLGNVWRFPAETQANGGAAFLLVYILCIFLLGIPVMLSEFALGRGGKSDAVGSFMNIKPGNRWWLVGGDWPSWPPTSYSAFTWWSPAGPWSTSGSR